MAARWWSCTNSIPRRKPSKRESPARRTGCPNSSRSWTNPPPPWGRACDGYEVRSAAEPLFQRPGGLGGAGFSLVGVDAVVGALHGGDVDLADQGLERAQKPLVAGPLGRDQHDGVIGRDGA